MKVSRKTIYEWIEEEGIQNVVEEARDGAIDHVENRLMDKIDDGDTTAIIFYLKTQGRKRGFGDKQEIDHNVKSNELVVTVKKMGK